MILHIMNFKYKKIKFLKQNKKIKKKKNIKFKVMPHDEEIIDLAHSTTYRRDKNKYLKAGDTDKARKIIEYIFSDDENKWED